jgi:lysophospholipase L1-like esterase
VNIPARYQSAPAALLDAVAALDLPLVDTTAQFRALKERGRDPYIPDDGHPSAAGHAAIADEIVSSCGTEKSRQLPQNRPL